MDAAATTASEELTFEQTGLPQNLLSRLRDIGYEAPSPIQAQTIPLLLGGRDLVGQAQTGTGKTAAFALPALTRLDLKGKTPQVLVLTPTRELSIQVAEAFQTYAKGLKGFSVLPVYGGQDYRTQISALKRGVHVIVGTPGRLMDHMRRATLSLDNLSTLVLDEDDEMLRMGFIDDVQWILEQIPQERQIALFSATMPPPIRRIAKKHLNDPVTVEIKGRGNVAATIRQRYWPVQGVHKLDALTRILEADNADGVIVFVRTKTATAELADKLSARGMRAAALNGEIPQQLREKTVERLRKGRLDILVATDVAARGLDVERISHVINYDIPYDTESYIHRIGRTGRAGRSGQAVLFVAPRERRMLALIERAIGSSIEKMKLPSVEDINERRAQRLAAKISETLEKVDLKRHKAMVDQYLGEHEVRGADVAAALAYMLQDSIKPEVAIEQDSPRSARADDRSRKPRDHERDAGRADRGRRESRNDSRSDSKRDSKRDSRHDSNKPAPMPELEPEMERFRLEVGRDHGAVPNKIVGAICNEGGLDSQYFGRISIHDEFSLVDLPEGMPKAIFKDLKRTRVCGRPLRLSRVNPDGANPLGDPDIQRSKDKTPKPKSSKPARKNSSGDTPPKRRKKPGDKRKSAAGAQVAGAGKGKAGGKKPADKKAKRTKRKSTKAKSRRPKEDSAAIA